MERSSNQRRRTRRWTAAIAAFVLSLAAAALTASPASAATVPFHKASWTGTIEVDQWMTVWDGQRFRPCPAHVTMTGTLTAPYLGRADFTMTFDICGGPLEGDTFVLTAPAGTITGHAFFAGELQPGVYYGAMCNFGSGTGRYARMIWPEENCALGGSIIAVAIVGQQPGITTPIATSGPVIGNATF